MRHAILGLVIGLCLSGAAMAQRPAERVPQQDGTARFYDNQGRSTGRAETRDGRSKFYDSHGRSTGRAETGVTPRGSMTLRAALRAGRTPAKSDKEAARAERLP